MYLYSSSVDKKKKKAFSSQVAANGNGGQASGISWKSLEYIWCREVLSPSAWRYRRRGEPAMHLFVDGDNRVEALS